MSVDEGCIDGLGNEEFELKVIGRAVWEEIGLQDGIAECGWFCAEREEREQQELLLLCLRKWRKAARCYVLSVTTARAGNGKRTIVICQCPPREDLKKTQIWRILWRVLDCLNVWCLEQFSKDIGLRCGSGLSDEICRSAR